MAEGKDDEVLDSFDMMFFMVGSTSPNALLEDFESPQNLSGSSSLPLLSVSSFDSGELVSSPHIACSKLLPQTECDDDDYWVTYPTPQEDLSLEVKSSHVSPLEEYYENATKRSFSYNTSECNKELYSLHKRMKRAASPTRNQEQRRIWGVSSTYDKKPSMLDWDNVSSPRVVTPTSEAGSKRGIPMSIPSQVDNECNMLDNLDFYNSDGIEESDSKSARSKKKATMSRNLVSERRRRHKLNEKLYSLRALVPNISKMDKASIVADAISYVTELKRQVEVMHKEVSHLAATHDELDNRLLFNSKVDSTSKLDSTLDPPAQLHHHQVVKFTMTHMQGQIYELQIYCKRSIGMWLQLTQAIEALGYDTISANFSHINDHILNNLIIEVQKEPVLNREELCDKTMEALLRFGFSFDIQKIKLEDM